jgi:hypothetical protein
MSDDMDWTTRDLDYEPPEIDTSTTHPARGYDYLLGGKTNYPVDREAAEQLVKIVPWVRTAMMQNRRFMHRVTRYLAAERGIDQFIDLGAGIPTSPNLHEIAQRVNPAARVVYVDNDPIVLTHSQALLKSTPQGRVAYVHADLRDHGKVLESPDLRATLDLDRPVGLTILSTVHLVVDDREAYELVSRYMRPLAPGSVLALTSSTPDYTPPDVSRDALSTLASSGVQVRPRTRAEMTTFFDGLDLLDPGVVTVHRWRPDAETGEVRDEEVGMYGGAAVKP